MNPLEVTEWLLRQPKPFSSGLVVNRPPGMTHAGRMFQCRMWRNYAKEWDLPDWHRRRIWVERVLRHDRRDCLRRVRVNLYLARRLRRGSNR